VVITFNMEEVCRWLGPKTSLIIIHFLSSLEICRKGVLGGYSGG
jgi:hypothetical protein